MAKFEIELRGRLTDQQRKKLVSFLKKNGKLVKEYKRTQWIFGLSHEKKIDFRIKETNGKYEFSLKVGKLGNANRKEISIPFPDDKIKPALDFAKYLGHREGLKAVRNAMIFNYKDIEWAVVEVPGHSYYFEAEKMVESKSDGKQAEKEIRNVADEFKLDIFTPKETVDYIKKLDEKANKKFKL